MTTSELSEDMDTKHAKPAQSVAALEAKVEELKSLLQAKEEETGKLRQQLRMEKFGVYRFSNDPDMMRFYTGFRTYQEFIAVF